MDFITLDFETANSQRCSPCEIGLTIVENNKIVNTYSWLIRPKDNEYDFYNTSIHGICESDTENEPEFDVIWTKVFPLIQDKFIIAHNASFDMSVLRKTLDLYNIEYPELRYVCSYKFSKKIWPGLGSYNLWSICKENGISFEHHRAGSDSRATAELSILAFEKMNIQSEDDFKNLLQIKIGEIHKDGYSPCSSTSKKYHNKFDYKSIVVNEETFDEDNLFYNKVVVFTGALSSMKRSEAQILVANIGGINKNSVSKNTDFLVVGQQDFRIVGEDGMSEKQEKASELISKGCCIEILSENDFLENIYGNS